MVRKTVELFECDVCGEPGERYTITFPEDGALALDRCSKHDKKIVALREERGSWAQANTRSTFKVSTLDDIKKQKKR